ncbi:MAG: tetratricopeptide repeat protein [Nitrospira sp.]
MNLKPVFLGTLAASVIFFGGFCPTVEASQTTVVAEGSYVMGDGDTLAIAEQRVLQRAQRRAVEQAGVYIESTFHDIERSEAGSSTQSSALEVRTIAAAITKTEILEARRSFLNDRPSFHIRIRAVVDLNNLHAAIQRWQTEQRLANHFHRLQKENAELKNQLEELRAPHSGVRTLHIEPAGRIHKAREQAQRLVEKAMLTQHLPQKLHLASQAAMLDPQSIEPLIVRGQTYLRLASAAYSNRSRPSEYSEYVDNARMDFDRAYLIDPRNTWVLLGQGDVNTWLHRPQEAARFFEQALESNPFFDLARHRLIDLYTADARKQVSLKQWNVALSTLEKCLPPFISDSWLPYQKEAYFLRSSIYQTLHQPMLAIDDLSAILRGDPADGSALLARAKLYQGQLQGRLAKDDYEHACILGLSEACEQLP